MQTFYQKKVQDRLWDCSLYLIYLDLKYQLQFQLI